MQCQELSNKDEPLERAWRLFVERGVIDRDIIRPDIARSWYRCRKQKDSSFIPKPLNRQALEAKQEKNRILIEAARPVMLDMALMLKNSMCSFSLMLMDVEGDAIEVINEGFDKVTSGYHCNEMGSGTTGAGLALIEHVGVEVTGYEHLLPYAHNWHTIGVPVRNNNRGIIGVFGLLNADGPCPPLTMQMVSLGAQFIESRLRSPQIKPNIPSLLLESTTEAAALVDQAGFIVDANCKLTTLLETTKNQLAGQHILHFLAGDCNASLFSSSEELGGLFQLKAKTRLGCNTNTSYLCHLNRVLVKSESLAPSMLLTFNVVRRIGNEVYFSNQPPAPNADPFESLIGTSPIFTRLIEIARKAARSSSNILIEGESGTGKELLAKAIHEGSRPHAPFIAINCGSIPRELLNSELFGYEEGSFTGAKKGGRPGKFELANRGTIFLDEIGEMPLDMQVGLLRFLEDRSVTRIGGQHPRTLDVRIISATNRNLADEVKKGNFREDLYYRLNVVYFKMPSLFERPQDIPLLANHLLHRLCERQKIDKIAFEEEVVNHLKSYHWPGNVRELQNVIESSMIISNGRTITVDCLPAAFGGMEDEVDRCSVNRLDECQKAAIIETLVQFNGNISKSAQALGITRTTLYKKMSQMNIKFHKTTKA
jgi:transcriptional regulator with PAS, ATPase and Fis domain